MVPTRTFVNLFILIFLAAACNYPTAAGLPTQPELAATAQATATAAPDILPNSVYYLSQVSGTTQVWRLERDGVSQTQITHEQTSLDGYDVSRIDGSVAYLVENQIYLVDADGDNRRLLVDNAAADPAASEFAYRQAVTIPRFSLDGRVVAYGYNGVWLYHFDTGIAEQVLTNEIDIEDDGLVANELYAPIEWSPDSMQLLVSISSAEGSWMGVWNASEQALINFDSEELLCCDATWAPDDRSVLLASATLGLVEPGLWRYDSATGAQTTLIETTSGDLYNFVGWPLQLANGDLQYFYASSAEIPETDLPLYIVHSAADGNSGRTQLRSDAFSLRQALWATDGSLVLVGQIASGGDGVSGPVVLVSADGQPLQGLLDSASHLRWGP